MVLYLKLFFSFLFAAALVAYPAHALAGAQAGLDSWLHSVAPALLPFIAVMPYLTCDEARLIYRKLFGRAVHALFRLPGGTAAAIVIGMIAGSPAGSMAVARVAAAEKLTRGQAARLAGMCCGVSPVYALSVMGVGMAGSERLGWCFVISQIASLLTVGLLFRNAFGKDTEIVGTVHIATEDRPVMGAVAAVLRVCGYMVVFSAGMEVAAAVMGDNVVMLSPFIDLPAGINYIKRSGIDYGIAAGALGFGGMCIAIQNLGVLSGLGVKPLYYFIQKVTGGIVCAVVFELMHRYWSAEEALAEAVVCDIFDVNMLFLALISVPVTLFFLQKSSKKLFS